MAEWIVSIMPLSMPNALSRVYKTGTMQLVVHDAHETILWLLFSSLSLIPYTIVASTSLSQGWERSTAFAQFFKCCSAEIRSPKVPLHSRTKSTLSSFQSQFCTCSICETEISSLLIIKLPPRVFTSPRNRPCVLSNLVKWVKFSKSAKSLIATIRKSA